MVDGFRLEPAAPRDPLTRAGSCQSACQTRTQGQKGGPFEVPQTHLPCNLHLSKVVQRQKPTELICSLFTAMPPGDPGEEPSSWTLGLHCFLPTGLPVSAHPVLLPAGARAIEKSAVLPVSSFLVQISQGWFLLPLTQGALTHTHKDPVFLSVP